MVLLQQRMDMLNRHLSPHLQAKQQKYFSSVISEFRSWVGRSSKALSKVFMARVCFWESTVNPLKDVGDDIRTSASNILSHSNPGILYLVFLRFAMQFLNNFKDLVHPGGAHGMAACLESAMCRDWNSSAWTNLENESPFLVQVWSGQNSNYRLIGKDQI